MASAHVARHQPTLHLERRPMRGVTWHTARQHVDERTFAMRARQARAQLFRGQRAVRRAAAGPPPPPAPYRALRNGTPIELLALETEFLALETDSSYCAILHLPVGRRICLWCTQTGNCGGCIRPSVPHRSATRCWITRGRRCATGHSRKVTTKCCFRTLRLRATSRRRSWSPSFASRRSACYRAVSAVPRLSTRVP